MSLALCRHLVILSTVQWRRTVLLVSLSILGCTLIEAVSNAQCDQAFDDCNAICDQQREDKAVCYESCAIDYDACLRPAEGEEETPEERCSTEYRQCQSHCTLVPDNDIGPCQAACDALYGNCVASIPPDERQQ